MTSQERRTAALLALSGCRIRNPRKSIPLRDLTPSAEKLNHAGIVWRQCKKKCAYETEALARKAANACFAKRGVRLRVYKCYYCKRFHLTKADERPYHARTTNENKRPTV